MAGWLGGMLRGRIAYRLVRPYVWAGASFAGLYAADEILVELFRLDSPDK